MPLSRKLQTVEAMKLERTAPGTSFVCEQPSSPSVFLWRRNALSCSQSCSSRFRFVTSEVVRTNKTAGTFMKAYGGQLTLPEHFLRSAYGHHKQLTKMGFKLDGGFRFVTPKETAMLQGSVGCPTSHRIGCLHSTCLAQQPASWHSPSISSATLQADSGDFRHLKEVCCKPLQCCHYGIMAKDGCWRAGRFIPFETLIVEKEITPFSHSKKFVSLFRSAQTVGGRCFSFRRTVTRLHATSWPVFESRDTLHRASH